MSIKQVSSAHVFLNGCETHYGLRSRIDDLEYPQVHDFYEIILVVSGKMDVLINKKSLNLKKGDLLLIRPGDIHSKIECGPCQHINLAFPSDTVEALFQYLYNSKQSLDTLFSEPYVPLCALNALDTIMMQNRLSYLNLLPSTSIRRKNTYLRTVLTEVISSYFMVEIEKRKREHDTLALPTWMIQAIDGLSDINNLEAGMDYLVNKTNRTPEHICRAFRKHMNITPMTFINTKRLNYAANLLCHSDKEIIDIAFESGFQSVSHFYHLFKKEFQISPLKYRNQHYSPHAL